jgi:uridine kinase
MSPYLIGIAGPSCSGKSEVARRLSRILHAPIVALDHYYRDLQHIPFEKRLEVNFDAPDALDHDLIVEQARSLKQGKAIEKPTYDFTQHVRAVATEAIESAEFIILEGLFALYWGELRELLDLRIYITADHEVCLERRIFRDVRERGRTEESVRRQYEGTVRPMCEAHIAPTRAFADIALSGVDPVKQSVHAILTHIPSLRGGLTTSALP